MVEYKKGRENRAVKALSRVQPSADSLAQDASLYLVRTCVSHVKNICHDFM